MLIEFIKPDFEFADNRGALTQLVHGGGIFHFKISFVPSGSSTPRSYMEISVVFSVKSKL